MASQFGFDKAAGAIGRLATTIIPLVQMRIEGMIILEQEIPGIW